MLINRQWLQDRKACEPGVEWFLEQQRILMEPEDVEADKPLEDMLVLRALSMDLYWASFNNIDEVRTIRDYWKWFSLNLAVAYTAEVQQLQARVADLEGEVAAQRAFLEDFEG